MSGKKKTSKIIPQKILNLALVRVDTGVNLKTGQWSQLKRLEHSIKEFLESVNDSPSFAHLNSQYADRDLSDLLKRAFNRKQPNGAVKDLRDLLCLFATDGSLDWNGVIDLHYPELGHIKDDDEDPSFRGGEGHGVVSAGSGLSVAWPDVQGDTSIWRGVDSSSDIHTRLQGIEERIHQLLLATRGEPEELIIKKQADDAVQKNKVTRYTTSKIKEPPSEDDPNNPEFPPKEFFTPKFPATETRRIEVAGLTNVWLKDESTNPTGTHKDRMAWEVTLLTLDEETDLPEISLISSGSAAIAIQYFFNLYGVDSKLNVLVDKRMPEDIRNHLKNAGCKIYETDLSEKKFSYRDIKQATDNKTGIDITYRETMDIRSMRYYDWMSYEILNIEPDFCFIPFGTGDLFINVLNIVLKEIENRGYGKKHDPRFQADIDRIKRCHFLGATTDSEESRLDKLFSYFLPNRAEYDRFIRKSVEHNCFGTQTRIRIVKEEFVGKAIEIASRQGIKCEPSGIAGLALLLQMKEKIPPESKVLIVNTGCTNYTPEYPPLKVQ